MEPQQRDEWGALALGDRLGRMSRFFREAAFVAHENIGTLARGEMTAPTDSGWLRVKQDDVAVPARHYVRSIRLPAGTYGKLESRNSNQEPLDLHQCTAQRKIIPISPMARDVRLSYMRFDPDGLVVHFCPDNSVWLGYWIPGATVLASQLHDLASWTADLTDPAEQDLMRRAYRASRKIALDMVAAGATVSNWESENLSRLYQETPTPPAAAITPSDTTVQWDYFEAAATAIGQAWNHSLKSRYDGRITFVPYPHIDNAWFMPETLTPDLVQGAAGTLAHHLSDDDVAPHFGPAMYWEVLEATQPRHFAMLRDRVHGEDALLPSTWAEPDFTLISGDSIVSQFRLARDYAEAHWGRSATSAWYPDAPGLPACMPQLLADAGIRYLFTARLRFNDQHFRPPPKFTWRAPGGAEITTEVALTDQGYLGTATGQDMLRTIRDLGHTGASGPIYSLGYSGGGLPTSGEFESLSLLKSMTRHIPLDRRISEMRQDADAMARQPTVDGPLDLYAHRGHVSVDVDSKSAFRAVEEKIEQAKLLAVVSTEHRYGIATSLKFVQTEFAGLQAHDTIDATAPHSVNVATYQKLRRISDSVNQLVATDLSGPFDSARNMATVAVVPQIQVPAARGAQQVGSSDVSLFAGSSRVQALDTISLAQASTFVVTAVPRPGGVRIESPFMSVDVAVDGSIRLQPTSSSRSSLFSSPALSLDLPVWYDGWDIDSDHHLTEKQCRPDALELVEIGPVRVAVLVKYRLPGGGSLRQTVSVWCNSARVEVTFTISDQPPRTALRWHAKRTSKYMTVDTPYGVQQVPHSRNDSDWTGERIASSWVCQHDDDGGGVAVSATAPFGFRLGSSTIDLGIQRAPLFPDPHSSEGSSTRRFSLVPVAPGSSGIDRWMLARESVLQMHDAFVLLAASEPVGDPGLEDRVKWLRALCRQVAVSDVSAAARTLAATVVNVDVRRLDLMGISDAPHSLRRLHIISENPSSADLVLEAGEIARIEWLP